MILAGCLGAPVENPRNFTHRESQFPFLAYIDAGRVLVNEQDVEYLETCGDVGCRIVASRFVANDFHALDPATGKTTLLLHDEGELVPMFHYLRPRLFFPIPDTAFSASGRPDSLLGVDCAGGGTVRIDNEYGLVFRPDGVRDRSFAVTSGLKIAVRHCPLLEGENCTVTIRDVVTGDSIAAGRIDGLPLYLDEAGFILHGLDSNVADTTGFSVFRYAFASGARASDTVKGKYMGQVYLWGGQLLLLYRLGGKYGVHPALAVPGGDTAWNELGRWAEATESAGYFEIDTATAGYIHRTATELYAGNARSGTRRKIADLRAALH